jgi:tRNA threonylcarbamoyladenosine biosynthesis protein TsaE
MEIITKSRNETISFGKKVASKVKGGELFCLYGNLGSGKTTFMEGFIGYFIPKKRVLSPTFIISRQYVVFGNKIKNIVHADLYRIENVKDIEGLGFSEYIKQIDTVIAVEWAEKWENKLPDKRTDIYFEYLNENSRKIIVNYEN